MKVKKIMYAPSAVTQFTYNFNKKIIQILKIKMK